MQSGDINKFFERNGYLVVPGVLSPKELSDLRTLLEDLFARTRGGPDEVPRRVLLPCEIFAVPEIYSVVFKEPIVRSLKELLEPRYTVFPDLMVQRNMFGYGRRKGWHTDSGSEGRSPYLTKPDYRFVKCGLFLQDNNPAWGGAIDVLPGGHRFPLLTQNNDLNFKVKVLRNRVEQRLFGKTLNIRAGDFVAFDSRLPHTSTWPRKLGDAKIKNDHIKNVPGDKTKFAVYWNACRSACTSDFLRNSERRAEKEEIQGGHAELFFADYLRLKFPETYPADFVRSAMDAGLEVASLDEVSAREWNRKYKSAQKSKQVTNEVVNLDSLV
jgi:hypothetical protein